MEEQKVGVFWDFENVRLPREHSPFTAATALREAALKYAPCPPFLPQQRAQTILSRYGYLQSIKAYMDTELERGEKGSYVRSALQSSGISVLDTPHAGSKDVADKMMIVDMLGWCLDVKPPATIILISGDRDFAYCLSTMRNRRYRVILISPNASNLSSTLKSQADEVLDWRIDVLKLPPLASKGKGKELANVRGESDYRNNYKFSQGPGTVVAPRLSTRSNPPPLMNPLPNKPHPSTSSFYALQQSAQDHEAKRPHNSKFTANPQFAEPIASNSEASGSGSGSGGSNKGVFDKVQNLISELSRKEKKKRKKEQGISVIVEVPAAPSVVAKKSTPPKKKAIEVVVLSSSEDEGDRTAGAGAGAVEVEVEEDDEEEENLDGPPLDFDGTPLVIGRASTSAPKPTSKLPLEKLLVKVPLPKKAKDGKGKGKAAVGLESEEDAFEKLAAKSKRKREEADALLAEKRKRERLNMDDEPSSDDDIFSILLPGRPTAQLPPPPPRRRRRPSDSDMDTSTTSPAVPSKSMLSRTRSATSERKKREEELIGEESDDEEEVGGELSTGTTESLTSIFRRKGDASVKPRR